MSSSPSTWETLEIPGPVHTWGIGWHSFRTGCPDDPEIVEFGSCRGEIPSRAPPSRNALYNPVPIPRTRGDAMAEPTYEELKAKLAEMEKQGGGRRSGSLEFRVGEKGGVSVYGLGRFPVTLYYEQWIRLLEAVPQLRTFLEENKTAGKLKLKEKYSE